MLASREDIQFTLLHDTGVEYSSRTRGDRADNLERSIAKLESALAVLKRETSPREWGLAQYSLGNAYFARIREIKADNLERAIVAYEASLSVRTRDVFPSGWATSQDALGGAYNARIRGDRADNLERAIAAFEAALTVRTREAAPKAWADSQHNLGTAYSNRVRGERTDNLERAIAGFQAALTVVTRETFPKEWAGTQNGLAVAYARRVSGDRADNLERAINALTSALTVRTRNASPKDWAESQINLGLVYSVRIRGDEKRNLEQAIVAFEAAVTVYTRTAFPEEWADAQNNFGNAYQSMAFLGHPVENMRRAIAAFEAALAIRTRTANPRAWADIQHNLGLAFFSIVVSTTDPAAKSEALQQAIAHFRSALMVRTREGFPLQHMQTSIFLGQMMLERRDWQAARSVFGSARDAFLLMFGQGLDETEARNLIEDEGGLLFTGAAFAEVQLGAPDAALSFLSEGKARLLAVALNIQGLDLTPEKRRRLDELQKAIREQNRILEGATGNAPGAALEKLSIQRKELLGLVKGADRRETGASTSINVARGLVSEGGALIIPIVTNVGAKILIFTAPKDGEALMVLDLPALTVTRVHTLLRGDKTTSDGGWIGAYSINNLPPKEQSGRIHEWYGAIDRLGSQLWELFAGPLDEALRGRGLKRGASLIWLPPGALGVLPLSLAQNPTTKERFVDNYEITYAPGLEPLKLAKDQVNKTGPASLAAIINPTGDLEATEAEGELVASHFTPDKRIVVKGNAATPDAVLAALRGKSYWHFASHGQFSWTDARQSALVMHDKARLTVARLLEASGLGRPRLVVLSACETGLFDTQKTPDEFIGFPGAFMALGAMGVLATLWPVDDNATSLLIAKFYELHLGSGLAPSTALMQAQKWLQGATNQDLVGFVRATRARGQLSARQLVQLEGALSAEALMRGRFNRLVQWPPDNPTRGLEIRPAGNVAVVAKPYAHPYFWGGFVYTGG